MKAEQLMKKIIGAFLLLVLSGQLCASARSEPDFLQRIEAAIQENEPAWIGGRDRLDERRNQGTPAPEMPRGMQYSFGWKRGEQTIRAYIFYGDTRQDATQKLDWSQKVLQINISKPLDGVGEQAYLAVGNGWSWVQVRKGKVFVYLTVYLAAPRQLRGSPAEAKRIGAEAAGIAVRFSKLLVDQIADH
jgi:hypothetical protein